MSDPAKSRRKIFTNKCSAKGCHVKEIVRVICNDCKLNFCLKHRHPTDHQCEGAVAAARRRAVNRPVQPQRNVSQIQGNMSEDEALARALALSLQESSGSQQNGAMPTTIDQQLEEDRMLARAIAESERQQRQQRGTTNLASKERCSIS
ncbi:AN1-type zinc finger protein 2B [Blattella germanica]|nr:AN1-type zinc finger protein 2B [Blattella germanica]